MSQYNNFKNLRSYIVSYHDNNVILMYCPALFGTICFVLVSVSSVWSLWHWAKDIGYWSSGHHHKLLQQCAMLVYRWRMAYPLSETTLFTSSPPLITPETSSTTHHFERSFLNWKTAVWPKNKYKNKNK